jgi:hypothetical protein
MSELPYDLVQAMDEGELTVDQLRQLIEFEGRALNLDFDEVVKRARTGDLPATTLGTDLRFLVGMLPAAA